MVKPLPTWFRPVLLAVAALALLALFTREISDYDFWWTLKSGRYIAETHRLPVPDPFAFTTPLARDAYAGESVVRRFNLTFEWLAQLIFFGVYRAGGFGGIVLFRGLLLAACCALTGLVAWRRSGGFYRALAAAFAAASVLAIYSASDRSYLFTFFFLAVTLAILEFRKWLWLLPAIALLWANCHGGFFLQWIAVGAYCAEAAWLRYRGRPERGERTLWIVLAACVLASAANPNGYRVLQVLQYFRTSFLQSKLLEWRAPILWPLTAFSALLFAGRCRAALGAQARTSGGLAAIRRFCRGCADGAAQHVSDSALVSRDSGELHSVEACTPRGGALRSGGCSLRRTWSRRGARRRVPVSRGGLAVPLRRGRFPTRAPRDLPDVQYL